MYKILIVDDDIDLIEGQKLFLESKNYKVETAVNNTDGLEKAEKFLPDLILVDLMMEHYDSGFVFCKQVRDIDKLKTIPIIMQTSASKEVGFTFDPSNADVKSWTKVDEMLTKPVPLNDLLGKIEHYLD